MFYGSTDIHTSIQINSQLLHQATSSRLFFVGYYYTIGTTHVCICWCSREPTIRPSWCVYPRFQYYGQSHVWRCLMIRTNYPPSGGSDEPDLTIDSIIAALMFLLQKQIFSAQCEQLLVKMVWSMYCRTTNLVPPRRSICPSLWIQYVSIIIQKRSI